MLVLLTGHRGYIGSVMTPMLLEAGHDVVGCDSDLYEGCTYPGGGTITSVPTIRKDVRDLTPADMKGFGACIHLAALSNDPLSELNPAITYAINHHGSVRLAVLAKEAGIRRFLFASSCSNYGAAGDNTMHEADALNPVTAYGRSKVAAEGEIAALADSDFWPTFLRPATAHGVSPRLRLDIVLNNLVAAAVTTGVITLRSDGSPWRPVVHIEDIACAFIAALGAPPHDVANEAFNVGRSDQNYRIIDIAETVARVVPSSRIEISAGAGPDTRSYRVSFEKISRVLPSFKPRWTVASGARQLYASFSSARLTRADVDGPRYQRTGCIKEGLRSGALNADLRRRVDRPDQGLHVAAA